MSTTDTIRIAEQYLMPTYTRLPVVFVEGRGSRLIDANGREYLDFLGGIAVNPLGHCPEAVVKAVQEQARRLLHVSNLFYTEPQTRLAELLVRNSFADRVFFCNSGAEANEAAIKLARKYGHDHADGRDEILTMEGSFHGRTLATLTATGQAKVQKGFEPLLPGFRHVPFDDLDATAKAVTNRTVAIMVEPIQGEGGVRVPAPGYLKGLRELCNTRGLLLILDEVQTGMGRTGTLFAYEQAGIEPDILTLAKGLGSGLPIGACLATGRVAEAFGPGSHASTFGGNPLACAAAEATLLALLTDHAILNNCRQTGGALQEGLQALQSRHPVIRTVRGRGLMVGMELSVMGQPIVEACLQHGVIINCVMDTVLRFLPPLIITKDEIGRLLTVLDRVLPTREAA